MPTTAELFGSTYDDARSKFRAAADANGARLGTHVLEGHKGKRSEEVV